MISVVILNLEPAPVANIVTLSRTRERSEWSSWNLSPRREIDARTCHNASDVHAHVNVHVHANNIFRGE